jgi:hypothetical protein
VSTSLPASTGSSTIAPMQEPPTARAAIEVRVGVEAPEGVLTHADGRACRFHGWVELAAAIEDLVQGRRPPEDTDQRRGHALH